MPQKHQDTKIHKTKIIKLISLVRFCDLLIWWQNNYFSEGTQFLIFKLVQSQIDTLAHWYIFDILGKNYILEEIFIIFKLWYSLPGIF